MYNIKAIHLNGWFLYFRANPKFYPQPLYYPI